MTQCWHGRKGLPEEQIALAVCCTGCPINLSLLGLVPCCRSQSKSRTGTEVFRKRSVTVHHPDPAKAWIQERFRIFIPTIIKEVESLLVWWEPLYSSAPVKRSGKMAVLGIRSSSSDTDVLWNGKFGPSFRLSGLWRNAFFCLLREVTSLSPLAPWPLGHSPICLSPSCFRKPKPAVTKRKKNSQSKHSHS